MTQTTATKNALDTPIDDLFQVLYSKTNESQSAEKPRYGVFWHREEQMLNLLLPTGLRAEVIHHPEIHRVPVAPDWLLGLVNIRGVLTPVIDFARWAGLPSHQTLTYVLHLGEGNQSVAWQIEQQPSLLFTKTRIKDVATISPSLASVVTDMVTAKQQDWFEIDYSAWLKTLAQ